MKRVFVAMLAVASLCLSSCSDNGSVSGKVTLDGQPMRNGTVTFHPVGAGVTGMGVITGEGQYKISVGTSPGLPPGDYLVTVDGMEELKSDPVPAENPVRAPPAPKRLTPIKFASKDTTDLRFTVKGGGNTIDLPLSSGP